MQYASTRGRAPILAFDDVLLQGLARDGGLYLPTEWPQLSQAEIAALAGLDYAEAAQRILTPFIGGTIPQDAFDAMTRAAYGTFHHEAVAPLVQVAPSHFVLELFHGPTMAFKDVAMQLLARLMDHVLARRGQRATIIGATSGDTGGAAIEAFRGRGNTDMFILFPEGRVSDVQRKQMTTVKDGAVHPLAVRGTFDDCQAMVKALFNDHTFRDEVALSGVNSINWARIMAQIVYFFTSAVALGAPARPVSFSVPTGNFGDIFAGYAAMRMGLPVERLVIATNTNDILARCLETGRYETRGVEATQSPSMDIQVSSNFERLLFEAGNRDAESVSRQMDTLSQSGAFTLEKSVHGAISRHFAASRCDEAQTAETIRATLSASGYLADPHTAVGLHAARLHSAGATPMVTLATAHPAKFPDAVEAASGIRPQLPAWQGDLMERDEEYAVIDADTESLKARIRQTLLQKQA